MADSNNRISIIGAGNLAYGLGWALKSAVQIEYIYSRTHVSATKLARRLKSKATRDIIDLADSDMIICAVDDDSLMTLAKKLKPLAAANPRLIFLHTSGTVPITVFRDNVSNYGAFYPLQTFTSGRKINMSKVPILIHSNSATTQLAIRQLAEQISRNVIDMDDEMRSNVHLPAVFINNFVNHLICKAEGIADDLHLDKSLYYPLLEETIKKAKHKGACNAQTGPAIREDLKVLSRHRQALAHKKDLLEIYNLLTDSIIKMYHENSR